MFATFIIKSVFRLFWQYSRIWFTYSTVVSIDSMYIFNADSSSYYAIAVSGTSGAAYDYWSLICDDCEILADFFLICSMKHFLVSFCCCFISLLVEMSCLLGCCRGPSHLAGSGRSGSWSVGFGWLVSKNFDLFEHCWCFEGSLSFGWSGSILLWARFDIGHLRLRVVEAVGRHLNQC